MVVMAPIILFTYRCCEAYEQAKQDIVWEQRPRGISGT